MEGSSSRPSSRMTGSCALGGRLARRLTEATGRLLQLVDALYEGGQGRPPGRPQGMRRSGGSSDTESARLSMAM